MAKQITYLIGAGASFNSLMLAADFSSQLKALADATSILPLSDKSLNEAKEKFRIECYEFISQSSELTVDYVAKTLWDGRHQRPSNLDELRKLKTLVSLAFGHWQLSRPIDRRYLDFFSKVLVNYHLPPNVKIISWNYDSQLELALGKYRRLQNHQEHCLQQRGQLNICTNSEIINRFSKDYQVVQLNGCSSLFGTDTPIHLLTKHHGMGSPVHLLEAYNEYSGGSQPNFSFAFESDVTANFVGFTKDLIANTEILVIIGYSFPEFNRDIDSEILSGLSELEGIVIQDKNAKVIERRVLDRLPIDIINQVEGRISIEDYDKFHLP